MTVATEIRIIVHDADGAEVSRRSFAGPRVRIGRVTAITDGHNDIVLPDDAVSREHAHLLVAAGTITLVDRGSINGTMVNGQMVREQRLLQPGDSIGIGPYLLRCDPAPPEPPPPNPAPPSRPPLSGPRPETDDLAPVDPDLPDFDFSVGPTTWPPPAPAPDLPEQPLVAAADTTPGSPVVHPGEGRHDDLASSYRALARQYGAPAWGRPAPLTATDWARVLASVRAVVHAPLWPERLADELCGSGPLGALLDDPGVTAITVCGTGAIQVRRGPARELASARFSCPEAIFACHERWTGVAMPATGSSVARLSAHLGVTTLGRDLAPAGPVLHITRAQSAPGLADLSLTPAAAELLGEAMARRARVIVHGDASADLGFVAAAFAARRPGEQLAVRVARSGPWSDDATTTAVVTIAGEHPQALRHARGLHPDWLIVEDLAAGDALDLRAALAGPAGLLGTLRARTADLALERLVAALAAATAASPTACRAELAHDLDLFVEVRSRGGHPRIHGIRELRPGDRSELVDLFLLEPDHVALTPTGVEPRALRERYV